MKLNPEKCYLLLNTKEETTLNLHVKNSSVEKLLGINFDYQLNLGNHIGEICQKSIKKVKCTCKIGTIKQVQKFSILPNTCYLYLVFSNNM